MANNKDFKVTNGIEPSSYYEKIGTVTTSGGTATLDMSTGTVFTITAAENLTIAFSNPPASGTVGHATLVLTNPAGAYTFTYGVAIEFEWGVAPTATAASTTDILTFMTVDGGTSYVGALSISGAV
jgi:hypothetical protein